MILYPAIDLKAGECVRLYQGDMDKATVYNRSPLDQALQFQALGAEFLHVVDLDGAFAGHSANRTAIEDILSHVKIPVQIGGGIRDLASAKQWIERGVSRIVLGTAAIENMDFALECCKMFPGKVAIGLDARDNRIAIRGWAQLTDWTPLQVAERFSGLGEQGPCLIYTDIGRDGTGSGNNIQATTALARAQNLPVIASGGISDLDNLKALAQTKSVAGAILGRSLYNGQIDLAEALQTLSR